MDRLRADRVRLEALEAQILTATQEETTLSLHQWAAKALGAFSLELSGEAITELKTFRNRLSEEPESFLTSYRSDWEDLPLIKSEQVVDCINSRIGSHRVASDPDRVDPVKSGIQSERILSDRLDRMDRVESRIGSHRVASDPDHVYPVKSRIQSERVEAENDCVENVDSRNESERILSDRMESRFPSERIDRFTSERIVEAGIPSNDHMVPIEANLNCASQRLVAPIEYDRVLPSDATDLGDPARWRQIHAWAREVADAASATKVSPPVLIEIDVSDLRSRGRKKHHPKSATTTESTEADTINSICCSFSTLSRVTKDDLLELLSTHKERPVFLLSASKQLRAVYVENECRLKKIYQHFPSPSEIGPEIVTKCFQYANGRWVEDSECSFLQASAVTIRY